MLSIAVFKNDPKQLCMYKGYKLKSNVTPKNYPRAKVNTI